MGGTLIVYILSMLDTSGMLKSLALYQSYDIFVLERYEIKEKDNDN